MIFFLIVIGLTKNDSQAKHFMMPIKKLPHHSQHTPFYSSHPLYSHCC